MDYWSNIPKQTIFGFGREDIENPNATIGDCFRCCIGAIINIPAKEIPHFVEEAEKENKSAHCLAAKWLAERGYWFVTVEGRSPWGGLSGAPYIYRYADDKIPELPIICSGPTIRSKTWRYTHVVVMAREELLYDPHPSNAGLLAITCSYLIIPFYAYIK